MMITLSPLPNEKIYVKSQNMHIVWLLALIALVLALREPVWEPFVVAQSQQQWFKDNARKTRRDLEAYQLVFGVPMADKQLLLTTTQRRQVPV